MSCDKFFYPSGALYAYLEAEKRHYFYEDGKTKTIEHYLEDRLHGEVFLYWPNGQLKRKCQFQKGKRFGKDQMWDEQGKLVDEQEYV